MTDKAPEGYYVYALIDPRDLTPFYIGQGKGRRRFEHVEEWYRGDGQNHLKLERIGQIIEAGLEVQSVVMATGLTQAEARQRERREICLARALRPMTNLTPDGGYGYGVLGDNYESTLSVLVKFRTRSQYLRAIVAEFGRHPTLDEWCDYHATLNWWLDMKAELARYLLSINRKLIQYHSKFPMALTTREAKFC